MKHLLTLSLFVCLIVLGGCNENILVFPTLDPALVRIVNTTQDVGTLDVVVDGSATVTSQRGFVTEYTSSPAGRPVGFVLNENGEPLRRDTLFYTLGGNAKVILFARGAKATLVEFRRAIQDTTLAPTDDPVIRFTHMAENTDFFVTLELFFKGGEKVYDEEFDPGLSSGYASLAPGTYSFEVRSWETGDVAATLENVEIKSGQAYMLYAWDENPPAVDQVALSVF